METERLNRYLFARQWTFAKTMPKNPHEYTIVKHGEPGRTEFEDAVATLQALAEPVQFGASTYRVYFADGWRFWSMSAPTKTIGINRTRHFTAFDSIECDNSLSDHERATVRELLAGMHGPIIDIGSGSGLLPDLIEIDSGMYIGIDPSERQIAAMKAKHGRHTVLPVRFEAYEGARARNVVALNGALNYVMPRFLFKAFETWNGNGRLLLMFYKANPHPERSVKFRPIIHDPQQLRDYYGPNVKMTDCGRFILVHK